MPHHCRQNEMNFTPAALKTRRPKTKSSEIKDTHIFSKTLDALMKSTGEDAGAGPEKRAALVPWAMR